MQYKTWGHVPNDILSEILTNPKLSIEDIVRCAFVCKSWYSHVTSPSFVSLHSTQKEIDSFDKNKKGLFLVIENKKVFSLNLDDDSLSEYKRLDFPLKIPNKFKVVDCINGVVCLWDDKNYDIVLWNPSIRKLLELSKPLVPFDSSCLFLSTGFGFDAATNDYKVVRALIYNISTAHPEIHAEVYESSVGRWRRIERPQNWCSCISYQSSNQAFLNGFVHWVGFNKDIVSFDFPNEVFGRLDVPYDCRILWDQLDGHNLCVSVMGGESLSLIYHNIDNPSQLGIIWVMKEYDVADSWMKLYTVSAEWEVLCMRGNGELLVKSLYGRWLQSYTPDTKCVKKLKMMFQTMTLDVFQFTESLALLGGVKDGKHG